MMARRAEVVPGAVATEEGGLPHWCLRLRTTEVGPGISGGISGAAASYPQG